MRYQFGGGANVGMVQWLLLSPLLLGLSRGWQPPTVLSNSRNQCRVQLGGLSLGFRRRVPQQQQQQQQYRQHKHQKFPAPVTTACSMTLVPLPVEDLEELLNTGVPSGPQYATYWGRTKREKYNQVLESAIVTFIGVFFSYFLSFVLGGFVATIFGCLFAFWGILSPDFKARQRNWELLGGRELVDPWEVDERGGGGFFGDNGDEDRQGLYGSFLLGRVDDVCVVEGMSSDTEFDLEDFSDYTMDSDTLEQFAGTPYLLRVRITDDSGRELQVHARMSEEYLDIEPGMPIVAILLSKSRTFSSLAALTDVMIPDANCWVGDYPYLNRPEVETLLADDDKLWDMLQAQGEGNFKVGAINDDDYLDDDDDYDDDYIEEDFRSKSQERVPVPVRRRR